MLRIFLLASVFGVGCTQAGQSHEEFADTAHQSAAQNVVTRGVPISMSEETELSSLNKTPQAYRGKELLVKGKIEKVCQMKGCWMELVPLKQSEHSGIRITFKDYGFFVPMDVAGWHATVQGTLTVVDVDEPTKKHMKEEGATVADAAQELRIEATGVALSPPAS